MTLLLESTKLLDRVASKISEGAFTSGIADTLVKELWMLRSKYSSSDWQQQIKESVNHPLHSIVRDCPLIDHSYRRPRGYPGDAELIDYFYFGNHPEYMLPENTTQIGREIFIWAVQCLGVKSIRQRRDYLSNALVNLAENTANARILSIAAGHARELAPLANQLRMSKLNFTALDQDEQSLKEIGTFFPFASVHLIKASVIDLLSGSLTTNQYDFIYSMGLYDYLPDSVTERLSEFVYTQLLAPGGTLLIANYTPKMEFAAFMEIFMNWELIYRDRLQVLQFARRIEKQNIEKLSVESIADGLILVMSLKKPLNYPESN
jgi:extracellular factor (EF) 3-hydroxypalmitic acid methyl ester biosynthesis protein